MDRARSRRLARRRAHSPRSPRARQAAPCVDATRLRAAGVTRFVALHPAAVTVGVGGAVRRGDALAPERAAVRRRRTVGVDAALGRATARPREVALERERRAEAVGVGGAEPRVRTKPSVLVAVRRRRAVGIGRADRELARAAREVALLAA